MRLEIDKEGVFIPSFNGNRDLPPTDQIAVRYKTPTVVIKNRCRKKPETKGVSDAQGNLKHMETVIERDSLTALREMLVSVSNCSYGMDGKENNIVNAGDLINAPLEFEPLLNEIIKEFDRLLDKADIQEKN